MPVYEYKCKNCKHRFELLVSIKADPADIKCPECGAGNPEKQFSAFSSKTGACSSKGFS